MRDAAGDELAARAAEHFEACNDLLGAYLPLEGVRLKSPVIDIRPSGSKVDFLSVESYQTLALKWYRATVSGASHFTLVQDQFVDEVASLITAHTNS